jgi:hypothetical protein
MKHKNNGKLISLFALLFMAFSNSLWSAEVDTVWVSIARGSIGLRHNTDNGNIMLMNETAINEVDKSTGELIQKIDIVCKNPFKHQFSPNTKYIGIEDVNILRHFDILSYPNLDTIYSNVGNLLRFINNEEIVFYKDGYLNKYNFITKETIIGTDILPSTGLLLTNSDMVVSSKGKYIALQLKSPIQGNDNDCNIDFSLFDGKTLKRIKQLEYWQSSGFSYYPPIMFSEDETKLGVSTQYHKDSLNYNYKVYDLVSGKLNIFNTINNKEFIGFEFSNFGKKYYLINAVVDNNAYLHIIDLNNNQSNAIIMNVYTKCYLDEVNNLLFATRLSDAIGICINLNKIINGIENPNNSQEEFVVNYQNEILEIRTNSLNIKRIQITNMEGIILQNFELPMATGNFITPLKLPSGIYIVKVISYKNESLTKKIITLD